MHRLYPHLHAVVRHLLGVVLGIAAVLDQVHPVPDPLDDRAAHKDGAFQRIFYLAVKADGNGGDQTVLALVDLVAGVHQQETAGAVGVFHTLYLLGYSDFYCCHRL